MMEFNGEMGFGRSSDRRVEIRRFPVTWSMGLAKEGSRRKLRRWVSFSRSGFGIHGGELVIWPTNASRSSSVHGVGRKKKMSRE
jgi:hypothetical protein